MSTSEPKIVAVAPQPILEIRETLTMDALPAFFPRAYDALGKYVADNGVEMAGPPLAVSYGKPTDTIDIAAAFPVKTPAQGDSQIRPSAIPKGSAATLTLTGSYEGLAAAYETLLSWMAEHGHEAGPLAWEQYLTMESNDPATTVTQLYWLLATE